MTPSRRRRLLRLWPLAALLLVAPLLIGARAAGWDWFVVQTPSMGRTAPVGTLIVTTPVRLAGVRVGDVVTYRPPGETATVTHRVVAVTPEGLRTRGDVNTAEDPWTTGADRLVGRAAAILPWAGWLVRGLPMVAVGVALVLLVTLPIRARDVRAGLQVVGGTAVLCGVVAQLRPLIGVTLIDAVTGRAGGRFSLVSTGVLPVRVSGGGAAVDLVSGQVGVLRLPANAGRVDLIAAMQLPPAGWAVYVAVCLLPLAACVVALRRGAGEG